MQSSKPKASVVGECVGVENDESDDEDASENAELMLSVRCNVARPTGLSDRAASCSVAEGD